MVCSQISLRCIVGDSLFCILKSDTILYFVGKLLSYNLIYTLIREIATVASSELQGSPGSSLSVVHLCLECLVVN